jgi:hypothetical protein
MNSKFATMASALLLATGAALPSHAAILNFVLSGSRDATFQLDSNPTPTTSSTSVFGDQVQFSNVAGTFGGVTGVAPSIGFGSGLFASLNINGTPLGFTQFAGPSLFSGTFNAPVFAPGTFALTSIVSGSSTLTISEAVSSAVPEPATWTMMIMGFGLAGAALRGRRRTLAAVQA